MFPVLAIIFIIVPVIEIYLLIQVGQVIGALWTALLVVLTAVIGVHLLKSQGLSTFARAQKKIEQGEMPAHEMLEGLALLVAGAFLLTPGFFTDSLGFLLLLPPTRLLLIRVLSEKLVTSGSFVMHGSHTGGPTSASSDKGDVIEGVNYREEKD